MKKHLLILSMAIMAMTLSAQVETEVITGQGYPDEVYYSLDDGIVATSPRATWDLGFATSPFSVTILANNASSVEVYTYPLGDTADWATLDTTGMTWDPLYNSMESLNDGAFNAHSFGMSDVGWGVFDHFTLMTIGDSLYVIKTIAGEYKKLEIVQRNHMAKTWTFKVAGLDGSNDTIVVLDPSDYADKRFVYYSLSNMEIVDREPAKDSWDLVFTKYVDYVNYDPPSQVSGVLTNELHMMAQEVREEGLDQATFVDYVDSAFSDTISIIGSDWKSFNLDIFDYELDTTVVYFLKKYSDWDSDSLRWNDSAYHKLYFTAFDYTEGKYTFIQEKLAAVSSRAQELRTLLNVYPNPASDWLNLVYDYVGEMELTVFDLNGRMVLSSSHIGAGFSQLTLDISSLKRGIFLLKVKAGNSSDVLRFIKQ